MGELSGKVVALVGRGGDDHRAIAVACAEAGAAIALGTVERTRDEEFAVNSIANEVWSIGEKHFVRVMDAAGPTAAPAFADECWDTLGKCDGLVVLSALASSAPIEELSPDEWDAVFRAGATVPYLHIQAFGRLMVRNGGGHLVTVFLERAEADPAERGARAALVETVDAFDAAWRDRGVRCALLATADPVAVVAMIAGR